MVELSVGQVSGFIAFGVFILQLFFPLALVAIAVAFLSEENSIVTWSVIGRFLHSSQWPSLLGTDTAASTGVQRRVNIASWLPTVALFLVMVASIVTPLGLYDSIEARESPSEYEFAYVRDDSAFGHGTPHRAVAPFTRNCGVDFVCPGTSVDKACRMQGLLENCTSEYDREVPQDFLNFFSKGAAKFSPSVSSIFDIQWRTYVNASDTSSKTRWYLSSAFRQLSVLILDETIKPVEGLIVDMKTGGIGFRNHTVPKESLSHGSRWTEDILFIEPETQCVDLNITLDFKLPLDATSRNYVENLILTDRGGFSALDRNSPKPNEGPNGQSNLNLRERAYAAAWMNNFLTLVYFNATDPDAEKISRLDVEKGATFPLPSFTHNTTFRVGYETIRSNLEFGEYLNLTNRRLTVNRTRENENPHGVTTENFDYITMTCGGSRVNSPAKIDSSVVGCGLLYGAANRTDGKSSLIADPGSPWSVPVYSCASALKATIRTVTLQYNGTGFDALKILSTELKHYQDKSSIPLWGVEDLEPMQLDDATPAWGILGTANSTSTKHPYNISTISQESLYLPGFVDQFSDLLNLNSPIRRRMGQNFPGTDFFLRALRSALSIDRPNTSGYQGYADYSGQSSLALYAKWQKLSESAAKAGKILDLVWTDVAANAVVGTKGWGLTAPTPSSSSSSSSKSSRKRADDTSTKQQSNMVPITVYEKRIRYRIPFAVPAFIVLACTLAVVCALIILATIGKTSLKRIRTFLDATSPGRILGIFMWPEEGKVADTKEWIKTIGVRRATAIGVGTSVDGEEGLLMSEGANRGRYDRDVAASENSNVSDAK
ncbi:hypothetical protein AJ80_03486 [Polytolypa hystricis UAMH7299]|uniref:Uncharacterized protein n=1 Tax=Polytolypa hystricis (strain UAMH7299) TaxID=1447883 RepID=A0A2B7YGR6_POLH7|nr:hypothetical protein AJ80_03486 [Polytolypa hystricis UAMH7299]